MMPLRFLGGMNLRGSCEVGVVFASLSEVAFGPARVAFEVEKLEDCVIKVDDGGSARSGLGDDESSWGRKGSMSPVWIIRMKEFLVCICHTTFSSIRTRLVISSSSGRQSTVAGNKENRDCVHAIQRKY